MSGSSACSVDNVIANEISFFSWLEGDRTCPEVADVYAAIQSGLSSSSHSTEISRINNYIKNIKSFIEKRKIDVHVAQDRANMVKRPEMTASYYDGWFPLNRPLKTISVPILIGFATLFLMFSLLILLEFFGLQMRITYFFYNFATISNNKPFWTMAAFALVCVGVIIYLFLR